MITAVIFDMDGVIADSEYFNVKAKHLILKQAGIEVDWHYHDKFLGTTHEYMWTEMKKEFESLDKEVSYYIDQWVKTRKELINQEGLKPMPGVVDLIRILKEKGFHLAVAFISGSECENGKPDPEIFQKAAEAIGQKAENCIVVEDSEAGVKAAKSAKMKCIGYAPEGAIKQDLHQADTVVKEFSDKLIEYIMGNK